SDERWLIPEVTVKFLILEFRKANAYKTALCQAFKASGFCSYGSACRFAHGERELRLPPQVMNRSFIFTLSIQQKTHPKYKTQLCNKFALFGRCPYGPRCQFIHQRPNNLCFRQLTLHLLVLAVLIADFCVTIQAEDPKMGGKEEEIPSDIGFDVGEPPFPHHIDAWCVFLYIFLKIY
ncbi:unnamed protein product, partial [Enterobius vermicularis]|uniref:C3H1-type domain-containing protein n=1 Tax=Enterobius vermicularis TaxID=51028 RepID=A0A0N4V2U4_ENTVE